MNTGFLRLLRPTGRPGAGGVKGLPSTHRSTKGHDDDDAMATPAVVSVITLDAVVYIAVLSVVSIAAGIWRCWDC